MARTSISSPSDEPYKWLVLLGALAAVGLLPRKWEKAAVAGAAILYFLR